MAASSEDLRKEVLALVCHHACTDLRTTCSALCASKDVNSAILSMCSGADAKLSIKACLNSGSRDAALAQLPRLVRIGCWMSKYGALVKTLELSAPCKTLLHLEGAGEAALCLAVRPPVQLQQLTLAVTRPGPFLQQLEPSRLTRITFSYSGCEDALRFPGIEPSSALSRLTCLQQLSIATPGDATRDLSEHWASSLAQLPQLTQLVVQGGCRLPSAAFQQLPNGLQHLSLARLPPRATVSQLTHLQRLTNLQLQDPKCTAAELAALGNLPQLQQLDLAYNSVANRSMGATSGVQQHSAVWGTLPRLCALGLNLGYVFGGFSATIAAGVAAATALTRLLVCVSDSVPEERLTAALSPLKQLQDLTLRASQQKVESFGHSLAHDLTKLTALEVEVGKLDELARFQVYSLTQLKQLVIGAPSHYSTSGTPLLGDQGLKAIAHNLQQLQRLALVNAGVTVEGLVTLLRGGSLSRLQQLALVCGRGDVDLAEWSIRIMAARPAVQVCCCWSRVMIEEGFVGWEDYE